MRILLIVFLLYLTSCLPAVTPTVKIINYKTIFGIRGEGNTTVTFEISDAETMMTIAGTEHALISASNEQQVGLFWEEDVIDMLIPPDTYRVVINDTDTWVILFGVANKKDIPVIIIQDFERDQE